MQDCDNQKIGINELAARLNLRVEKWIEDQGISGMKDPEKRNLGKLMSILKPNDHILVSEISRLGRELFMIFEILKNFTEKGIKLDTVKDNYHLDGSITSKVLAFAFGMAANIERDMISKRTIEGLRARRNAGVILGRPLNSKAKHHKLDKFDAKIKSFLQADLSYSAIAKILKCNRLTVADIVKANGWDEQYLSEHRQTALKNCRDANNIKMARSKIKIMGVKDFCLTKQDLLDLYTEHKSLQKIAELFDKSSGVLKNYIVKNNMWDDLVELDQKLRLEFPSINQQCKAHDMERLEFKRQGLVDKKQLK
jgi:DNA invertase Pin-like site-specific DNA recombinase